MGGYTGLVVKGVGRHLDMPGVVRHRVGYVGLDTPGEALGRLGLIQQGESYGVRGVSCYIPVAE